MNVALPAKDNKVHESLMPERMFKKECYSIMGACFEVYKANGNGNGFLEPVYRECLEPGTP